MIHDYKLAINTKAGQRRKQRSRGIVALAVATLIGVGITVRFVDLAKSHAEITASPAPRTQALALPTPLAGEAPEQAVPQEPQETLAEAPLLAALEHRPLPAGGSESPIIVEQAAAESQSLKHAVHAGDTNQATEAFREGKDASLVFEGKDTDGEQRSPAAADTDEGAAPSLRWVEHRIVKGDTLAQIFNDVGLSAALLHRIIHSSKTATSLADIRPGQLLRLQLDGEDELQQLVLQRDRVSALRIQAEDERFVAEEERKDLDRHISTAAGTIESSLFADGQKAGLDDDLIMELAAIFGWDIDFALEIRAGDRFSVVYEELYLGGEKVRNGDILAAEFVNRGTTYRAVRFESNDGEAAYYDPEGRNKRRAFIRTPVKFARVSSGFTTRRWHPVLKTWRSHKGVDYAAPTGTPVKATGAGRVAFKGWKGGYGKVVFIEHAGKYTTVYGHLSRFSSKIGKNSRVKQGQIIGYVGKTGLATGPHLHYEFRVNGAHRNPLTVQLPKSLPLPENQLAAFQRQAVPLLARLDDLGSKTLVADAEGQGR